MYNIYKIEAGELTETDLDIIVLALSHFLANTMNEPAVKEQHRDAEKLFDKILGRL